MEADTASLRNAAPHWSLAGDKQLLGMLQQIHQSILTKCQEANSKLEAMVNALDNASLDLQNVNNKFMALSNSQFVESRVYDDDVDIKGEETVQKQEAPQVPSESELQKIKRCLQKLEMMHEPVVIMDSDSSDDESSMVLKPKDLYAHRPLPHIIGSHAWKSKWHAGLLPEDSDSDSSVSKRENAPLEEYSDSEPELAVDATDKHAQRTISSSSMESEILSRSSQQVSSPAAVAAELARRLAGPPAPIREPETMLPPEPAIRKVYGMDKPAPATIFPNEPPPLDAYESDRYSDDDIFAELHKKPNQNSFRDPKKPDFTSNIVDELFGDASKDIGNIVDFVQPPSIPTVREDSPLFDDVLPPISNKDRPTNKPTPTETNVKKPVGGISLFGSNKSAESIGAAILKRHQRKSSSDEESDVIDTHTQTQPIKEPPKDNKKIIEDLFTKPAVKKKDTVTKKIDNPKPVIDKVETKPKDSKIDLFSDNLFDDIDDIFTTNVTKPKIDKTKSIFDDDDLFSDVVEQTDKRTDKKDTKSIFDSDDDLFNDNDQTLTADKETSNIQDNTYNTEAVSKTNETKNVKSIFDDNSDDDLFSVNVTKKDTKVTDLIKEKDIKNTKPIDNNPKTDIPKVPSDDNLFTNKGNSDITQSTLVSNKLSTTTIPSKQFQSPNLFDEDDDDDLFGIEQDVQTVLKTPKISKSKESYINEQSDEMNNAIIVENKSVFNPNNSIKDVKHLENADKSNKNINYEVEDTIKTPLEQVTTPSTSYDQNLDTDNSTKKSIEQDKIISQEETETLREKEVEIAENNKDSNDSFLDEDFTQEEPLFPEPVATESKEPDIFSDIFNDLPPAFEKPSESKKSKNVNALFDDDSDDEALFFKKNDVISDEKPDLDFSGDRFRIFHDEPPDIDVDFSQKLLKSANSVISEENIDDLFKEIPPLDKNDTKHKKEKVESVINKEIFEKEEKITSIQRIDAQVALENEPTRTVDITKLLEDLSENDTKPVDISKLLEEENITSDISDETDSKSESKVEQLIQNIEENKSNEPESKELQSSEEDSPKKSIGKLKPMNFNINVNTLLPGASPKKSKANEEIDGQIISTKNNEVQSPNTETKMVKSVSFEGDPDSGVLDNKLSKERAKIQVKRRPSTRRARLEAVRKSGIDFGSDSTDNSSSFDEPKPKDIDNEVENTIKVITRENTKKIEPRDQEIDDTRLAITPEKSKTIDVKPAPIDNTILDISNSKIEQKTDNLTHKTKPEVKSKVVYILNDEDIFSNTSQNTTLKTDNATSSNIENIDKINKHNPKKDLSKDKDVLKARKQKDKPLFDDLSDEELFGSKKPVKPKESLFDSDSEEELFSKRVRPEQKKETARASLFGDESDDDDLFASKPAKVTDTKPLPKPSQSTNKPAEPVFEDPLSMLGGDES